MRKPKTWKPVQGQWTQSAMSRAIQSVKDGKIGIRKAAQTYGVPKSTLQRRIKLGIVDMPATRPPVFSREEEALLHSHVLEMEKMGFGLTVDDVCRVAFEMAEEAGIQHRFSKIKKRAGYDWYVGFRDRHPDLSLRKPEALSAARASMLNPTVINDHFRKLGDLITTTGLENKPSSIYNADETGFSLVHTPSKILAKKGKRTVQARTSAERGENVTALICGNAAGHMLPPFLIFKGQRLNPGLTANAPAGTLFGVSASSFIDAELFETWFEKHFLQQIPPSRPVLLILDGHGAHISLSTLKLAKANSVHMYCLPPHTTNHTQPLDKAVFKSMKSRYNQKCEQFLRDNPGKLITRYDFCGLFKSSYYSELTMANIVSGFRATGVYPFDPTAIREEHLQQSSITAQLTYEEDDPPLDDGSPPESGAALNQPIETTQTMGTVAAVSTTTLSTTRGTPSATLSSAASTPGTSTTIPDTSPTALDTSPATRETSSATPNMSSATPSTSSTTPSTSSATPSTSSATPSTPSATPATSFATLNTSSATLGISSVAPTTTSVTPSTVSDTSSSSATPSTSSATPFSGSQKFAKSLQKPILYKKINSQKRSRRITEGRCMTSAEIISSLERKQREKEEQAALKEARKLEREQKRKELQQEKERKLAQKAQSKKENKKRKVVKKSASAKVALEATVAPSEDATNDRQNYCGHCNGYYYDDDSDDDDWWPCKGSCGLYWHESCTGVWQQAALEKFKCENCCAN